MIKLKWGQIYGKTVVVTSWKYDISSRYLKIFYSNGTAELYHPVPEFVYDNLLLIQNDGIFI